MLHLAKAHLLYHLAPSTFFSPVSKSPHMMSQSPTAPTKHLNAKERKRKADQAALDNAGRSYVTRTGKKQVNVANAIIISGGITRTQEIPLPPRTRPPPPLRLASPIQKPQLPPPPMPDPEETPQKPKTQVRVRK